MSNEESKSTRERAVSVEQAELALVRAEEPLPPLYQFLLRLADQLGDVFGVLVLTVLCMNGKLTGDSALVGILAVLGVNNGVRVLGAKARGAIKAPPGLGALAIGLSALASLAHFTRGNHTGFARVRAMRSVAVLSLALLIASLLGCAGNANGTEQALNGYATFHVWAQRVCGVLTALPSPPAVRSFVGGSDAAALPLDASQ